MSRNYKFSDQTACYFVTMTVVHWIDVFSRKDYRDIIFESLEYCKKEKGLIVHAYVIMSNHVHLIISSKGKVKLESIVRDLKKFTSKSIIKSIQENISESRRDWMLWMFERTGERNKNNSKYQFWQQHNHPIILNNDLILNQKIEYIHQNPVRNGLIVEATDYLYSSAKNYEEKSYKIFEVDLI
ncbi:transposase [Flammeovirga sp. SubArs3]|uniref:REP-associated tyrosine transposase n=1 Tax=Flammeovirga sp. SubArs3 TaxID=2995316 RepID=UPI00248C59EE|nr:transposase [Flammeovirga sp. SubArs3]